METLRQNIETNLSTIHRRIIAACEKSHRQPESVQLLAVSKKQPARSIEQAVTLGQIRFGENYLQEALPKINHFLNQRLEWHYIGTIQSNKTDLIAKHFDWAVGVDSIKIAERLNKARGHHHHQPLNICIQINLDEEPSKSGIKITELEPLLNAIMALPHLQCRGLMTLPHYRPDPNEQRLPFRRLSAAFNHWRDRGYPMDTLSMGTSSDFEAAILEGSTMIRLGEALFGPRSTQ